MDFEYKKSGQIPRFGDWDNANEMPITQYFECARQAGLVRYSSSSGEYDPYVTNGYGYGGGAGAGAGGDLYSYDYKKPSLRAVANAPPRKKKTQNSKRWPDVKERSGQVKVRDMNVMEHPRKQHQPISREQLMSHTNKNKNKSTNLVAQQPLTKVKPVDEDLYKIPPELLQKSERRRMLGFFSRCLVPPCNT